jgi:hypothetical protein
MYIIYHRHTMCVYVLMRVCMYAHYVELIFVLYLCMYICLCICLIFLTACVCVCVFVCVCVCVCMYTQYSSAQTSSLSQNLLTMFLGEKWSRRWVIVKKRLHFSQKRLHISPQRNIVRSLLVGLFWYDIVHNIGLFWYNIGRCQERHIYIKRDRLRIIFWQYSLGTNENAKVCLMCMHACMHACACACLSVCLSVYAYSSVMRLGLLYHSRVSFPYDGSCSSQIFSATMIKSISIKVYSQP